MEEDGWPLVGHNFLPVLQAVRSRHHHICLLVHGRQKPFNIKQKYLTITVTKNPQSHSLTGFL